MRKNVRRLVTLTVLLCLLASVQIAPAAGVEGVGSRLVIDVAHRW
jgi:hypothetical protein